MRVLRYGGIGGVTRAATLGLLVMGCFVAQAAAQGMTLVGPGSLSATENAVFLADGRYFVAGGSGVHEVKRQPDSSPGCTVDPLGGLTLCMVVPPELDGDPCLYTGMTTDGERLYAACTVVQDSLLGLLSSPERAALLRIEPGEGGNHLVEVAELQEPAWYNGMAILDDGTLLASRSQSGWLVRLPGAAIDRFAGMDAEVFEPTFEPWLESSSAYLAPNGVQVQSGQVYFSGGQNLFRIPVQVDGSAGQPELLYQAPLHKVLDDFAVDGDMLVVAEIALLNGLGRNTVSLVATDGSGVRQKVSTGSIQLSSIAVDPGTLGAAGAWIATSYYQGGVYLY